ncbi:MAG: HAD-IA family hydrolase [Cyanobacteria bacterium J06632_22]
MGTVQISVTATDTPISSHGESENALRLADSASHPHQQSDPNVTAQVQTQRQVFRDIDAVVFDKDGTLASVETYLALLHRARLQALSISTPALLNRQFGVVARGVDPAGLLAVGSRWENETVLAAYLAGTGQPWITARQRVRAAFSTAAEALANKAAQTPLIPGSKALLAQLKSAGLQLAIATADTQAAVDAFVAHHQLGPILSHWKGVSREFPDKTQPGFLQHLCQKMGVIAPKTLVCGDAASDWLMAESAGAAGFIGFTGGWSAPFKLNPPSDRPATRPYALVAQLHHIRIEVDE